MSFNHPPKANGDAAVKEYAKLFSLLLGFNQELDPPVISITGWKLNCPRVVAGIGRYCSGGNVTAKRSRPDY
jgi:hypothetical protein